MSEALSRVSKALYEDIVMGVFPPGSRLIEEPLVERYDVKRHVLREAFGQLEDIALIQRVPNRGVKVHEPTPREMREVYALRLLLESHAAKTTDLPVKPDLTARMRTVQAAHSRALRQEDFRSVLHLNLQFHRIQFSACANATLVEAIEGYARRTHLVTALKFPIPEVMARIESQHFAIIEALEGSDQAALIGAVEAHFDCAQLDRYEILYKQRHGVRDF